jgi:hypothetical protein
MGRARVLALPLALGALLFVTSRLAIAPLGDAIAGTLTVLVKPAPPSAAPAAAVAEIDLGEQTEAYGPPVALPRRVASRATAPHRETIRGSGGTSSPLIDEGKDGGARPAAPSDVPKGTIMVPASVVTRALEKRDVGATNAVAPDGAPLGARLAGVSKYRTGLRDGDVVVSVAGTRTPTVAAMVAVGMSAASGATRLSGQIRRGDATYAVVIELPK